ncbi:MAG: TIGR03087 family PEP-CTERM/XrtA system glycosyltransferase [Planctomycetes bacterium]|nr:TIGR03087 family PEP-CTERM/XrtA system glycosyltransferase [Planctomycetota bacterium]
MPFPFRDVVFLSQRIPHPPDRGDRISTYHILKHFRGAGCRVRVGCFLEDERDERAVVELRGMVEQVVAPRIRPRLRRLASLRGLLRGEALTLPYFRSAEIAHAVTRWMRDDPPDLIFCYSSSMGQYGLPHPGVARVMHFAELDSDKWRQYAEQTGRLGRWIYGREATRLLEFERRVARAFDASLVVSDVERDLFVRSIEDVVPQVVPNGVDVEHFTSRSVASGSGSSSNGTAREPHSVIFTGVMDYGPNVDGVAWFAAACWPRIRAVFADARLLVVGNRPAPRILALDGKDGITVTGWVEATPPWFDRAGVAIAPLRLARGLQNKVLEAMSMGLPVVATPQAAQGLGAVDQDALTVAPDADAITAAVLRYLREPALARATGSRAARFVRKHFRWEHMLARLDATLETVAARRAARTP